MVKIGKGSKRQTTKHRVKVEKKIRAHNKKQRRDAKKNPKKVSRKDPGIPNILPFREEVIKEAEAYKQRKEEEREKKKAKQKKARERMQNQNRNLSIINDGHKRQEAYDKQINTKSVTQEELSNKAKKSTEISRKTFYKEFSKVVEVADVVLEILDARDPLGSRCVEMEDAIRAANGAKKLILVLNKIDLVPKENVTAWLKHLRMELPTVAFKASTQEQKDNLGHLKMDFSNVKDSSLKSSRCLGAEILMKLLKNYCRETEMHISVGVVGFPNTGKSSIINSLKRSGVCDVGAVPGITRAMQTVSLDKHIKLLDSPGVVLNTNTSDVTAVLRNVVQLEAVEDPVPCVEAILSRCKKVNMMLHYNIPDFSDTAEFLNLLARRMGKLKKGGVPDLARAARRVLQDWNSGKITYYTAPPENTDSSNTDIQIESKIITTFDKEFDINEITEDECKMIEGLESASASHILVPADARLTAVTNEAELEEKTEEEMGDEELMEDEAMEEAELKGVSVVPSISGKKGPSKQLMSSPKDFRHKPIKNEPLKTVGGLTTKKDLKRLAKSEKKKKKKANALAGKLSDQLSDAFAGI